MYYTIVDWMEAEGEERNEVAGKRKSERGPGRKISPPLRRGMIHPLSLSSVRDGREYRSSRYHHWNSSYIPVPFVLES